MRIGTFLLITMMLLTVSSQADFSTSKSFEEVRKQSQIAFRQLRGDYHHVKTYQDSDLPTRIFGQAFGFGENPQSAAEGFVAQYATVLGAESADLIAVNRFNKSLAVQPVMYDPGTDSYKFSLVYYSQYRNEIPVFRSELRLLVREMTDYPVVLAVSTIRNLGDFQPSDKNSVDHKIGFDAALADNPALSDFKNAETVIWAGIEDEYALPRLAVSFTASNDFPEKWVYVTDAFSGELLYKENQIIFEDISGNVSGLATDGWGADICDEEVSMPMPYARVVVDGSTTIYADENGDYSYSNSGTDPVDLASMVWGEFFRVINYADDQTELSQTVTPPGPGDFMHNNSNADWKRAEVNGYIHANVVRDYTLTYNPSYPVLSGQTEFPVWVNRTDGYCPGNAWYNGSSINFCQAGSIYPNTSFSTIIHHEYGHHLVSTAGSGQGQYGEGMSDVIGLLITDEAGTGFGFFGSCGSPLRSGDNGLQYPCDGEIHSCGQLISGCVWSIRNELIITYPADYRDILSNLAVNAILLHTGTQITPQITIDYLTLDDDDGNLYNGSPHFDELCAGFSDHNMDCPDLIPVDLIFDDLSDVTFGDGNDIPVAGETIEFVLSLENIGPSEITDVSVELYIDDGIINILDAQSFIGTIASGGTAGNSGDPISFEIPSNYSSRVDSFFLIITWLDFGEPGIDTVIRVNNIGATHILFVDDDNNAGVEDYYAKYFDSTRTPVDVRNVVTSGSPDSAYLDPYDMVVWFTGGDQATPLNSTEISALKGYMNRGGNLYLSGQGIAAQLDSFDPAFLNDYLKSSYLSTGVVPLLFGEAGGNIYSSADTVVIINSGAAILNAPDHLLAVGAGIPELSYFGTSDFAAVTYSGGDYKLVFSGFGLEVIKNGDPRFVDQTETMVRIVDFFNFQTPSQYPEIANLSTASANSLRLVDHTPDITWDYFDAGSAPQEIFQVQVDDDGNWDFVGMWDSGPIVSSATSITYDGFGLLDSETYFVRSRVYNGTLWSPWYFLTIRLNSPPSFVSGMEPTNLNGATATQPNLSHNGAPDAEHDPLFYTYELYSDSDMVTLVTSVTGVEAPANVATSWQVDLPLNEDGMYFWRVQATDGYEIGDWSGLAGFWVNAINQEPTPINLLLPDSASVVPEGTPTLTWEVSTDGDLYDEVTYDLKYSTYISFYAQVKVNGLTDPQYTLPDPIVNGETYYWKVTAKDLFGATYQTSTFTFTSTLDGDANGDGSVNVGDAVFLINFVFKQGPAPDPLLSGDANCDASANVGDAVYIINFVFKGGPAPGTECN